MNSQLDLPKLKSIELGDYSFSKSKNTTLNSYLYYFH